MRLAVVSLDQRWLDKETNFLRCAEFVRAAAGQGCELVVFPEMTLTGYSLDTKAIVEPADESPTLKRFGELARDMAVDVIFGVCLLDPASGRPRNTLCLAHRNGSATALYAKIHPFSFAGEEKVLEAGSALGMTDVAGLRLGCSICYDLRFPEMYSALAPRSNAVVNIANWPARRVAHWRTLLVARAIENQLFVFGVNRIGMDGNGLQYEKSSIVVAPDGTVLDPAIPGAELDIYDIDSSETDRYRAGFPTVRDKRYSLYRDFFGDQAC